ncbi:MAG: hypothetical protein ISQ32_05905, partial [Rickettsiales bacterium]|nr:hypothetical protein [Rickettsiales bacterium]
IENESINTRDDSGPSNETGQNNAYGLCKADEYVKTSDPTIRSNNRNFDNNNSISIQSPRQNQNTNVANLKNEVQLKDENKNQYYILTESDKFLLKGTDELIKNQMSVADLRDTSEYIKLVNIIQLRHCVAFDISKEDIINLFDNEEKKAFISSCYDYLVPHKIEDSLHQDDPNSVADIHNDPNFLLNKSENKAYKGYSI